MALFIRSDIAFSAPLAGTPILPPPPYVSDTFKRANRSGLGTADAGLGGAQMPWVGVPNTFNVVDGRAVIASEGRTSAFFTGFEVPYANVEVSLTIHAKPSAEAVWLDIRRPLAATSPTQNAIRLTFEPGDTVLTLVSRTKAGAGGTSHGPRVPYQLGDRIGFRIVGTQVQVLVNSQVMSTQIVDDPDLMSGRHIGFAGVNLSRSLSIDDFVISPAE